jgi:hypothetical protein
MLDVPDIPHIPIIVEELESIENAFVESSIIDACIKSG